MHSILGLFVYQYDSHMMGCPPSFLVSRVASLLKKIGTGETSFPACSCANSYTSPVLNALYARPPVELYLISACVYCRPAKRAFRKSSLMASYMQR